MTATFSPAEFVAENFDCYEMVAETARLGVSDTDAEGLSAEDCAALQAYCEARCLEAPKFVQAAEGGVALEAYLAHHSRLWKAADPTEGARWVETESDAREIAAADPSLLYAREVR